jgi:hypothetical protein
MIKSSNDEIVLVENNDENSMVPVDKEHDPSEMDSGFNSR